MKKLIDNFANLLKVKTIVTFVVLFVFVDASLSGLIPASEITTIVGIVFAFYFGTQNDRKNHSDTDETQPPPSEKKDEDTRGDE